ncbi:11778_t:CDS:1, partial [Funneliformis caledonium]
WKRMFYLDVSVPFNAKNIIWYDLTDNNTPAHRAATSVRGGPNYDTLFYMGKSRMELVYAFDTK